MFAILNAVGLLFSGTLLTGVFVLCVCALHKVE